MFLRKLFLFIAMALLALPFFLHAQDMPDTVWTQMEIGGGIKYVKFLPDRQHLIDATDDTFLQIRKTKDGEKIKDYKADSMLVTPVDLSKDGKMFAARTGVKARVISYETGKLIKEIKPLYTYENQSSILTSLAFSRDGSQLALAYYSEDKNRLTPNPDLDTCFIVVYNTSDWSELKTFRFHSHWWFRVAYSPTQDYLVTAEVQYSGMEQNRNNCSIYLINTSNWEIKQLNNLGIYSISSEIIFSPDGKRFAVGTSYTDHTKGGAGALMFEMPDISKSEFIDCGHVVVYGLAFSKDSRYLAIGYESIHGYLGIWDVNTLKNTYSYNIKDYTMQIDRGASARSLDVSPDNDYLLAGAGILILLNAKWNQTDVKEENNSETITVYPNPSDRLIQIIFTTSENDNVKVTIYNSQGEKVTKIYEGQLDEGSHTYSWDSNNFSSGTYFCRIEGNHINKTIKIIINR